MAVVSLRTAKLEVAGVAVEIGEGNLTYTVNRSVTYLTSGNELVDFAEGDESPLDVTFSFIWKRISGTGGLSDLATKITGRSYATGDKRISVAADSDDEGLTPVVGATTSDIIACRPHACNLTFKTPKTCGATPTYTTYTFPNFRYESLDMDIKAGTISVSGKCAVLKPTIT